MPVERGRWAWKLRRRVRRGGGLVLLVGRVVR